jgi:two-component system chemotaxis response regulator CheB
VIRVMIVEDSPTTRQLLIAILSSDPEIQVVGVAVDGIEATERVGTLRPDVITMDVHMPRMNGFDATKVIMNEHPTPIVLVSASYLAEDVASSLAALGAGALTIVNKPAGPSSPDFEQVSRELVATVKAMAQVKVVRRWLDRAWPQAPLPYAAAGRCRAVAIGASTGGPGALHKILGALPATFAAPIFIVQHISKGFGAGFAAWLDGACPLTVKLAEAGEEIRAGTVYIAPDDHHLGANNLLVRVNRDPPVGSFRPSATYLYESLSRVYGDRLLAVILTGMGRDGVDGLRAVRAAGGPVIAQDEASSVVFGMPGAAVAERLQTEIVTLDRIAVRMCAAVGLAPVVDASSDG